NASVFDTNEDQIDAFIYGVNFSSTGKFYKHGLLYRQIDASPGTNLSYNWTSPVTVPDKSVVYLLHLDNNSRYDENDSFVYDFSDYNRNNGTASGNAFPNMSGGKFGGGWEFDGNGDYITITDGGTELDFDDALEYTWTMWVRLNSLDKDHWLVSKQNGGGLSQLGYIILVENNNQVSIAKPDGTVPTDGTNNQLSSSLTLQKGRFYHLAVVFDKETSTIYINGVSNATGSGAFDDDTSDNVLLGNSGSNRAINGTLDDVAFWNRTLSATEINDLYRLNLDKYFWKVNVTDFSGNNNESEARQIEIQELTPPGVTINFPKNKTYGYTSLHLNFNVTLNENGSVQYSLTGGANNITMFSSENRNFNHTNGSIADGGYKFNAYANDTAGNNNYTTNMAFSFNSSELSACGNLDEANKRYVLIQNVTTTGTCFTISADNITLEGRGYIVTGDGGASDNGVSVTSKLNITINNLNVTNFAHGIYSSGINNSLISGNYLYSNVFNGIYMTASYRNKIEDNIASSNSDSGLSLDSTNSYNTVRNNFMNLNSLYGFSIVASSNNGFTDDRINGSLGDAILLSGLVSDNNFTNTTISNTHKSFYDLKFEDEQINGTLLIDIPHIGNYTFTGLGGTLIVRDSEFGEVSYLKIVNGSGTNLTNDIRIGNNSVTVLSNSNLGLNRSANVSLFGSPGAGFVVPKIQRDGSACASSICANYTALNATTVIFNVTHWTNYSIGEGNTAPVSPTPLLNSTDGTNRTAQNLHCSDTLSDADAHRMNVTVIWYNGSLQHLKVNFNNSYVNGTYFTATLNSGNTTKTQNWTCGLRTFDGGYYSAWSNSSLLTILNTPPSVSLLTPANGNITINRTPTFTWSGSDDDSDALTYELNLTCLGGCTTQDSRYVQSIGGTSHTISGDLQYLSDNSYYYNWSARASDGTDFGDWAVSRNISIQALVDVILQRSSVDFGGIGILGTNDTTDDSPLPFLIENSGNSFVNISINSSNLWNSAGNPSRYYQFKVDNNTAENYSFSQLLSVTTFTNMPPLTPSQLAIALLNYTDATDSAEIDINVSVPPSEGSGVKSSTVYFTAKLAE
ncbi:right-handed parallel beta-helix repeat-containing protein, partial [Candidatus Pacearchaeota archaeon]|nr:right-handed parallel beta-helix repeat-containing protein [Candidatus Pacearchaeota archaeon]